MVHLVHGYKDLQLNLCLYVYSFCLYIQVYNHKTDHNAADRLVEDDLLFILCFTNFRSPLQEDGVDYYLA